MCNRTFKTSLYISKDIFQNFPKNLGIFQDFLENFGKYWKIPYIFILSYILYKIVIYHDFPFMFLV